jgi:hypothetical protein
VCLAGPPTFFALAGIRQFFHCFFGRFIIEMDSEIETLWCSEGSLLPSGTHEKTSDGWIGATLSFLLYEFSDLPVVTSEKRVSLASDKLQAGLLTQLKGRVRDLSNSTTVAASRPKAMSDPCIHVVFSLFLDSRRSGLPRI